VVVKSSRKNKHGNECGVLDIYIEDIGKSSRSRETNSGTCWLHHCCLRIRNILLINASVTLRKYKNIGERGQKFSKKKQ